MSSFCDDVWCTLCNWWFDNVGMWLCLLILLENAIGTNHSPVVLHLVPYRIILLSFMMMQHFCAKMTVHPPSHRLCTATRD